MVRKKNTTADFWSKVDKNGENGCWNWTSACDMDGYGAFRLNMKRLKSHRYSLELKLGRPIADGLKALHRCKQNRKCVNPEHLYEGTHQNNIDDMKRDGTQIMPKGESHHGAILTEDDVVEIRTIRPFGFTYYQIADRFNVSYQLIEAIVNRKIWKHI